MVDLLFGSLCVVGGLIVGYTYGRYPYKFHKPIILRTVPKEEAKKLILDYIKNNKITWTSDVIFDVGLSVDLVLEALEELRQEGKIEAKINHFTV